MVKSSIETLDDNTVKMAIELDESSLDAAVDEAFRKIAKQVRLPGFRPGKVPRKVIESHFGKNVARGQAIEEAIPDGFLEAAAEHEVDFIAPPSYDITGGEEEGILTFDATVQVRPQVNIGGYQNLKVEVPSPEPSVEDIDEQIDNIRKQFGELEAVERAAAEGDRVTIDIEGTLAGEPVEGLTASDYLYEVGSGFVIAELDEQLDGASAGDSLEFDAEHPDPDEDGDLSFVIAVKEVQEMKLPELTDDFVADNTEFESVDEFRSDIQTRLGEQRKQQANAALQDKTGEALAQLVDHEIPEAMIDAEVRERVNNLAQRMQSQGMEFAQYLELTGTSVQDMMGQMREPATEAVKVDLALRAVAKAEGLEPDEAELTTELEHLATHFGSTADDVREQLRSGNQLVAIRSDIAKRKAGEWIFEHLEIVDTDGNLIDRDALVIEEPEPDHDHADHSHEGEEE